ncbi:MAG TPA: AraC family transcriptional regulator [Chitinophagaceae bacterium]
MKYMISHRCKMAVKAALDILGLHYRTIELGEVDLIENNITTEQHDLLEAILLKSGLELIDDKKTVLTEKIKHLVDEMMYLADELPKTKISAYVSNQLHYDYYYLTKIFSETTSMSIVQYILNYKIEKTKELLVHDKLNLKEISYKLNYSSVPHLSNQFKKITGLTPTRFKKIYDTKNSAVPETIYKLSNN